MHIFVAKNFSGKIKECDEGILKWIDKNELLTLPLWVGDKIFLKLINNENQPFFSLRLEYVGEELISAVLNGKELNLDVIL